VNIHDLAERHLPGDYTVERVEFTDGTTRTKAIHSVGWSATNYVQYVLWGERGELWVEYYENDRLVVRTPHRFELTDRIV